MKNRIPDFENYYKRKTIGFMYEINLKRNTFKNLIKLINCPNKNIKVLDIGFGSGEILFSFDKTNELNGIEYSLNAIQRSIKRAKREGYRNFKFIRQDISRKKSLPFKKNYFDIIICSHVIQYLKSDKFILQEMRRIIKSNGRIIIGMPLRQKVHYPNNQRSYKLDEFIQRLKEINLRTSYILKNDSLSHVFNIIHKIEKIPSLEYTLSAMANVFLSSIPWIVLSRLDKHLIKIGVLPRQAFLVVDKINKNHENKKTVEILK